MEKHGLQLTSEQLGKYADQHILRYKTRLEAAKNKEDGNHVPGRPYVKVKECQNYLSLWEGIKAKVVAGKGFEDLEPREVGEIMDAYYEEQAE